MYRNHWKPDEHVALRVRTIRWMTLLAFVGFLLGAVLEFAHDRGALRALGEGLSFLAIMSALLLLGTSTHRIVSAGAKQLDEFELTLRYRAISSSYVVLGAILTSLWLLLFASREFGWWAPRGDDWYTIMMGMFLIVCLLPTAMLVWRFDPPEDSEIADEEDE